ncbi:MAG: hypothetical protein BWK77_04560 [Verrucomicrobia bacterium A1]|nr:MAG: hypothetical protein BWK77_04560 [Verrucomicrobia bacterium A1]
MTFDHERLNVYQRAIDFVAWSERATDDLPRALPVRDHLARAAESVPLNIAEGNGKPPGADRCRFLDIARGSALECAACLDVMEARGRMSESRVAEGKAVLVEVVSMLVGMIRANSATRVCESVGGVEYGISDNAGESKSRSTSMSKRGKVRTYPQGGVR